MTTTYTKPARHSVSRVKKLFVSTMAAAMLASMAVSGPASAAVINEPPALPHSVTIFPERDFVSLDGYAPNTELTLKLLRNGVQIGSATGTTDVSGFLEVNHPGGVCWTGSTPNILPNDKVLVTDPNGDGDSSRTINVTAEQAFVNAAGNVEVHGVAKDAAGKPLPVGQIEQRIVQPDFRSTPGSRIARRDIRADSAGGRVGDVPGTTANLSYDAPGSSNWTATYTGLNDTEKQLAVSGQTRVLSWMAANAAGDRLGVTIYEVGEAGGPGFPGCPAAADYAVTASNKNPAVNIANSGTDLILSGVAQDASAIDVTLNDQNATTPPVTAAATLSGATGAQTWKATIPAAQVAALKDGTLTASARYTVGADPVTGAPQTIGGVNLKILKDTVAPVPPTATPKAGIYPRAQSVTLDHSDRSPDAKIRYTVNGTVPNKTSREFVNPIRVTATQTIRAKVFDPAGNPSTTASFRYVIN